MYSQERRNQLDGTAVLLLLFCCSFWGFQQVLVKMTMHEIPPLWQATLRFSLASLLLWTWCRVRGRRLISSDWTLVSGFLIGLLAAAQFSCVYLALRDTSASRVALLHSTSPFIVAALLPLFVRAERLRPVQWLGLLVAFLAVALALSESLFVEGREIQLRGDFLGLAAGIFWGLGTIAIRASSAKNASAETLLFFHVAGTAAVAPFLSAALGEPWSLAYSTGGWLSIVAQGVLGAFVSFLTWMWLLRNYPATRLSAFTFLSPVFALLFGILLLGEPLTIRLLAALIGVAYGIWLVNRS